jgi:hypothetical protein
MFTRVLVALAFSYDPRSPGLKCRLTFTSVLKTDTISTLSRSSLMNRVQSARNAAAHRPARSRCPRLFTRARASTPPTTVLEDPQKMESLRAKSRNPDLTLTQAQALSPNQNRRHLPVPLRLQTLRPKANRPTVPTVAAVTRTVRAVTPINPATRPGIACAP